MTRFRTFEDGVFYLRLTRELRTDSRVMGTLRTLSGLTVNTLELPEATRKPCGIPEGLYTVVRYTGGVSARTPDPHDYRLLLLDVPGFSTVEIHEGNDIRDTRGCILVGEREGIRLKGGTSRPAVEALKRDCEAAWERGETVQIIIDNEYENK